MTVPRTTRTCLVFVALMVILLVGMVVAVPQGRLVRADAPPPMAWRFEFLGQWAHQPTLGVFNHQPTGMAFDQEGNLYVVDRGNHRVQVLDRQGQAIRAFGRLGDGPGEFWFPLNVAVDAQQTVYVTDLYNNRVVRFSQDGTPLPAWDGFDHPIGIGVGSDGSVYVSDFAYDQPAPSGRLYRLTGDGASRRVLAEVNQGFGSLKVKQERGGDVIYVLAARETIQQYSPEGGPPLSQWSSQEMRNPGDLEVDARGNIYVTSRDGNYLLVRSSRDGALRKWYEFATPAGVSLGPDGLLYVTDGQGGLYGDPLGRSSVMRIQRFTPAGQRVEPTWGSEEGHAPGQLVNPDAIAWDPSGYIWVHNNGDGRFLQFTLDGAFVRETPRSAPFRSLVGFRVTQEGNLTFTARCQVYTLAPTGTVLSVTPPAVSCPRGFVLDSEGNLYGADIDNHRVVKQGPEGQVLKTYGDAATLIEPEDVALDERRQRLYVLDTQDMQIGALWYTTTRIQVYRLDDGAFEATWVVPNTSPTRPLADALITHLDLDEDGYLYTADTEVQTVWKLEPVKGEPVGRVEPGGFGSGPGQFDSLLRWNTFALDPQGRLYTVESASNARVQVFAQVGNNTTPTTTPTTSSMETATVTPTFTPTPQVMASSTTTLGPTASPTLTASVTVEPSRSATPVSPSITVTSTPTFLPTDTPTPSVTATAIPPDTLLFLPYVVSSGYTPRFDALLITSGRQGKGATWIGQAVDSAAISVRDIRAATYAARAAGSDSDLPLNLRVGNRVQRTGFVLPPPGLCGVRTARSITLTCIGCREPLRPDITLVLLPPLDGITVRHFHIVDTSTVLDLQNRRGGSQNMGRCHMTDQETAAQR